MKLDWRLVLDADDQQLAELLKNTDLRPCLAETLKVELDYRRKVASGGSPSGHKALAMSQMARLRALEFLSQEALPEMIAVLEHPETAGASVTVWSVCQALERLGPRGAPAAESLLKRLLRDGSVEYPSRVIRALGAVSPEREGLRATLGAALQSALAAEQTVTILGLIEALGVWGDRGSLPVLLSCAGSSLGPVRSRAVVAIGQLGLAEPEVRARLLQLTSDPEWFVRGHAIEALAALGFTDEDVVFAARRILQEEDWTPDWSSPGCAARALRAIGGQHETLLQRLRTPDISSRLAEECLRGLRESTLTGWEKGLSPAVLEVLQEFDQGLLE